MEIYEYADKKKRETSLPFYRCGGENYQVCSENQSTDKLTQKELQSTLVISNSKGPTKLLSSYQ